MTDSADGILYAVDRKGSRHATYAKQDQIDIAIEQLNNRSKHERQLPRCVGFLLGFALGSRPVAAGLSA